MHPLCDFHQTGVKEKLFGGDSQCDRFRKILLTMMNQDDTRQLLSYIGVDPSEFGTHSIRKGSLTFISSGSTAGPDPASVRLRAGWTGYNVESIYIQYEGAGDQYVGRVASALPLLTTEFNVVVPDLILKTLKIGQKLMNSLS